MNKKVSARRNVANALREDKQLRTLDAKAQSTKDSFQNFAAKMGVGTDNLSSGGTYGFNPITRVRPLVEWIHRGTWIGGVAVDIVGDDMTRAGVSLKGDELEPEDIERIQEEAVALRIWSALNDNTRWSRVYGGSIAVHLVDGQQLNMPLRIETVRKGQYKGLITLDRWMLDPSLNDLVTEFGPHLGKPKYYTVNSQAPALRGQKIHYSRVIRMDGVDIPYTQRLTENLWGLSIYERLYDRMLAFDSATTGAAQLVYKSYLRTYAVEGLRELIAAGGPGLEGLVNYVQTMARFQSVEGIALIDGSDRLEESGAANFGGLGEALIQFGQQIAGALQIPLVRLFGQSPAGMSATGESDLRMYYDGIKQQQEKNLRIPVTNTYRMIAQSLGLDVSGGFRIEFNPLWQLSEAEKASIAQTVVSTMSEATEAGIMTKQAALKEIRRSSDVTNIGSFISNEDIEAAEDEIPPMPTEVEAAALRGGEGIPKEDAKLINKTKGDSQFSRDNASAIAYLGHEHNLQVVLEHPRGTVRRGVGWEIQMPYDYGFIRGYTGADGDQLDCCVGESTSDEVFVVNQHDPVTKKFDEHKVMLGYDTICQATAAYDAGYNDGTGPSRRSNIVVLTMAEFKQWLEENEFSIPCK